jgi:hypothetical protein
MATPEEWARLQYLEEKHAKRGLSDEEDHEMMELLVAVGTQEHDGIDPTTGEQRYRQLPPGGNTTTPYHL